MGRPVIAAIAAALCVGSAADAFAGVDSLEFLERGMCGSTVPLVVERDFTGDSCLAGVDPELFSEIRRRAQALARDICHGANQVREIKALGEDQLETDHAAWIAGSIMSLGIAALTVFPRESAADEQHFREAVLFARRDARRAEHRRPYLSRLGLHSPSEIRGILEKGIGHYRDEHRAVSEEYAKVIEGIEEDSSVFHIGHDQESVIRMLAWEEQAHLALRREEWRTLRLLVRAPVACHEESRSASTSTRHGTAPGGAGSPESGSAAAGASPGR